MERSSSLLLPLLLVLFVPQWGCEACNPNLHFVGVSQLHTETHNVAQYRTWVNLIFTSNTTDLIRFKNAGVGPGFLTVFSTLITGAPKHYKLFPDFRERWNTLYHSTVHPLLANGTIFGIYLGDELLWNCLPFSNLTAAVNLVRESVGAKPIVVYNEAYPPVVTVPPVCYAGHPIKFPHVPRGLSWMAVDYYPDEGTVEGAKQMYQQHLYPKMAAHQKALYISPAYGASKKYANRLCCNNVTRDGPNPPCGGNCTLAMIRWGLSMYDWFRTDERIVGTVSFHWSGKPGANHGLFNPGLKYMPRLLAFWKKMGAEIVSGRQGNITGF